MSQGNCAVDDSNVFRPSPQASMDLAPFLFFSPWDFLDVVGAEACWLPPQPSFYNVFPPLSIPSSCRYYGLMSSLPDPEQKKNKKKGSFGETVRCKEREDIEQYSLIKLKCRLRGMDPNNAAITFPAPKKLDFCYNSLIWIMKKWHKLDEPLFSSVSHMNSWLTFTETQLWLRLVANFRELKRGWVYKITNKWIKKALLYEIQSFPASVDSNLCTLVFHISAWSCFLFVCF